MFERKKQAMDSKCHSSMPEEGSYMYIGSYLSDSKRYPESEYDYSKEKTRSPSPLSSTQRLWPRVSRRLCSYKIEFAVEHTEHGNIVKLEHFEETDLAFSCRCAQL